MQNQKPAGFSAGGLCVSSISLAV